MTSQVRAELIQVAAVAVSMVTLLDQGNTDLGTVTTESVLMDVIAERERQEIKWGSRDQQDHDIMKLLGMEERRCISGL